MSTLAERLQALIDQQNLSARQLSLEIGASKNFVDTLLKGQSKNPAATRLDALAKRLGVRTQWLLTGEEPMLRGRVAIGGADETTSSRSSVLRGVYDTYPWPSGTPTDVVAAIWSALSAEEFAHRGAYIPPAHWTNRIAEELAARKGKRIAHLMTDDPVEERKRARKKQ